MSLSYGESYWRSVNDQTAALKNIDKHLSNLVRIFEGRFKPKQVKTEEKPSRQEWGTCSQCHFWRPIIGSTSGICESRFDNHVIEPDKTCCRFVKDMPQEDGSLVKPRYCSECRHWWTDSQDPLDGGYCNLKQLQRYEMDPLCSCFEKRTKQEKKDG